MHDDALWGSDRLDLDAYLARIGQERRDPSPEALAALHEAHVRAIAFENVDVLQARHPGVDLPTVADKLVDRGRGGYCFEHTTLFAAALEQLGYGVERRLGRVGDPLAKPRTHFVAIAEAQGERFLCDVGFGFSPLRPIPWRDGVEADRDGWRHRLERTPRGWELSRFGADGWELMHTTDELPVVPVDVEMGHHYTSTHPASMFRATVILARYVGRRHVTLSDGVVTIRTAGEPTERRSVGIDEAAAWIRTLEPALADDVDALVRRFA